MARHTMRRIITGGLAVLLTVAAYAPAAETQEELSRSAVRLAEMPGEALEADAHTLYLQSFDEPAEGVSGEHHYGEGRREKGLHLRMPDGRLDIDASGFELGSTGTIEWSVKPRPAAEIWRNQGWHYFLHLRPASPDSFQLDLWRHPRTSFRLSASHGLQPHGAVDQPDERIEIDTRGLDLDQWHHLLVSWDLTGDRQRIWLLVNGAGHELSLPAGTFEANGFTSIEFGNRPSGWDTPFIPLDGALDEIRVRSTSIADQVLGD